MKRIVLGVVVGLLVITAGRAEAGLLGTSVTGSLQFPLEVNFPTNNFDPGNRFVPSGFGNSSPGGTTVTIANPLIEFGFDNKGGLTHSADFTDTSLTFTTAFTISLGFDTFRMTFTDSAFVGLTLAPGPNTYPTTTTATLVGNVLTINQPFFLNPDPATYTAVFNFIPADTTPVPEPATVGMAGTAAIMGLGAWYRRRRRAA